MFELIALGIGGAAGLFGHVKSKDFVRRKLRYTKVAEKSAGGMGLAAGAATAIAAAPVVALLPVVGTGTAILVGLGVGTGVGVGIKQARKGQ
ncbi:MAG: hypothetical protein OXU74_07975 [Gemmatimonadota bacterium]|nr:hypothetical protein [Gemmatimonadota bacterium]